MKETAFKLGELFCGPGGLACGALSVRAKNSTSIYKIQHAWANDIDPDTCRTYARNICCDLPGSVICRPVQELKLEKLDQIDALAFGFPCNDFSVVGEQKGFNGSYGPLYTYGIKVINRFNPKFFVAENVGGIRSANEGRAFQRILDDLEKSGEGYCLSVHLYKSEEYGVPQTRHRVIIVGIQKSLGLHFQVPAPTTRLKPPTVREALENPPIPSIAPNQELTNQSAIVVERLRHIGPGENVWSARLPKHLQLKVKGARLSQIYKRLHPDKPSYTITGSGGGGTHVYHWRFPRALNNRERARIQTFPDTFEFKGSKESVRRQIGMAVPPTLAKAIFASVLKTFAGISYPHVQANIQNSINKGTSPEQLEWQYEFADSC